MRIFCTAMYHLLLTILSFLFPWYMPEETFEEMCERQEKEMKEYERRFPIRPLTSEETVAYCEGRLTLQNEHYREIIHYGENHYEDSSDDEMPALITLEPGNDIPRDITTIARRHDRVPEDDSWESTRRVCHRCGGEVFTYFNGLYWCYLCALADNTPQTVSRRIPTAVTFCDHADRVLRSEIYQMGKPNDLTLTQYVAKIWRTIKYRIDMYEKTGHEYVIVNGTRYVKWTNPFLDEEGNVTRKYTPYIILMKKLVDLLFGEGTLRGAYILTPEEQRTVNELLFEMQEQSLRMAEKCLTEACACDEMDALVLNFCHNCLLDIFARTDLPAFSMDGDFRKIHAEVQLQAIERRPQYSLPTDGYDEQMRRQGRDDHGEIVEITSQGEWIRDVGKGECFTCCEEDIIVWQCPQDGIQLCPECVARLLEFELGRCPSCRMLLH